MGTIVDPLWKIEGKIKDFPEVTNDYLPLSFDARTNWSNCANIIGLVRDQADCGSCWANATTETFNDRLCIASNGSF
jgi:cathepsin B